MIYAISSLVVSFIIAFGRQSAVFGKIESSLWFFSGYENKRLLFSIVSLILGMLALYAAPDSLTTKWLLGCSVILLLFSYLFDFKYIFPEIKSVEKPLGKALSIQAHNKVIGVNIDNATVAYPLEIVVSRHIVNDKIDSKGIVVCYCAICRSGLVFGSEVEGKALYFKVAGVWRRNMIMIDDKTKSLWQQATGECVYGPLKGQQLELLSGENTNWASWSKKYPDSLYAFKCEEARKGFFSRAFMLKGLEFATSRMTPPAFTKLDGLPNREIVFGLNHNGIARAYPISELRNVTEFVEQFNTSEVAFNYDEEAEYLTAIDLKSEKALIVEKHWWLGWKEFHPETEIWKKEHGIQQGT